MKGPTLRALVTKAGTTKPTVVRGINGLGYMDWVAACDVGHEWFATAFLTQPEAFKAAHRHALEHLGEDMGRWAEQLPPLTDETEL